MKTLHFSIAYFTHADSYLQVVYSIDGEAPVEASMQLSADGFWRVTLTVSSDARQLRHAYRVMRADGQVERNEQNDWRLFSFDHRSEVAFVDAWADHTLEAVYHRQAFAQCLCLPRGGEALHLQHHSDACLLLLHACPPPEGHHWAVVGSSEALGSWNVSQARPLHRTGTYEWALPLPRAAFQDGVDYKYVVIDSLHPEQVIWEQGGNRQLLPADYPKQASLVRQDEMPRIDLPKWKGVGVVIPVFSLRSEGSAGVGDFGDLQTFVRWAAESGLSAVQLLPINDTTRGLTYHDSYPYNGISVFALHPLYLDPRPWRTSKAYAAIQEEAHALNELPQLDYEAVIRLKLRFARQLYKEIGAATLRSDAYKQFVIAQRDWLAPYAQFCAYRDHFRTADFRKWPRKADSTDIACPSLAAEVQFYQFLQFLLDRQMLAVHQEARALGVLLKGDIPIGISPDSVPAWQDGPLFHFDGSAGAPPDAFAEQGQNWGFPTYDWDAMAHDHYQWWRRRLDHMARYFDAYRLDHVLGFFRIWEIPTCHVDGRLGYFRPALPFTADELSQRGFHRPIASYAQGYATAAYVSQLVLTYGDAIRTTYLQPLDGDADGGFTLRPPYHQERVIQQLADASLREVLHDILLNRLFLEDAQRPQHYHPCIAAHRTPRYAALDGATKDAYSALYDDFFYHRHNQYWADEAMKKLPAITQSPDALDASLRLYPLEGYGLLPCAEDLGMVPSSVKGVLQRLGILSLEIESMPKAYGQRFGRLADNPYYSVATIATHDMPPLRLWWTTLDDSARQAYWNDVLRGVGQAPAELSPECCERIVSAHVQSPSMLCLLALQDLLAVSPTLRSPHPETEQINVPANANHYWRYRMHLTMEQLIRSTAFSEKLRGIIACR